MCEVINWNVDLSMHHHLEPVTEAKYKKAPTFKEFVSFLVDTPVDPVTKYDVPDLYCSVSRYLNTTPTGGRCTCSASRATSATA